MHYLRIAQRNRPRCFNSPWRIFQTARRPRSQGLCRILPVPRTTVGLQQTSLRPSQETCSKQKDQHAQPFPRIHTAFFRQSLNRTWRTVCRKDHKLRSNNPWRNSGWNSHLIYIYLIKFSWWITCVILFLTCKWGWVILNKSINVNKKTNLYWSVGGNTRACMTIIISKLVQESSQRVNVYHMTHNKSCNFEHKTYSAQIESLCQYKAA